jgi:beta-galactosidase
MYGQDQGVMLYRTTLVGRKTGKLTITDLHDYALVFVDGRYVGTIDRRLGETGIDLPPVASPMPVLEILVEGMGHINFGPQMIDRKGITDRVTLGGMTLMNWQVFPLPFTDEWVATVPETHVNRSRPGIFFEGTFRLEQPADTFIDLTGYRKGMVWVNGHNLGRYWDVGPQMRLYCPAPWLRAGDNQVVVFDFHKTEPSPLKGEPSM